MKKSLEHLLKFSIRQALKEQYIKLYHYNVCEQYNEMKIEKNSFMELKVQALQSFQTKCMLRLINDSAFKIETVFDVGDSSGHHVSILRLLMYPDVVETISFNVDSKAIERLKKIGLTAYYMSTFENFAYDLKYADLIMSFETLEHMHNLIDFIYKLKYHTKHFLFTVPYVQQSRVGFHHLRNKSAGTSAEDLHIFELSPEDYHLIFTHYGWTKQWSSIYRQYPRKFPYSLFPWKTLWKSFDFLGFYGALYSHKGDSK